MYILFLDVLKILWPWAVPMKGECDTFALAEQGFADGQVDTTSPLLRI